MQANVTHITLEKLKRDAKRLKKINGLTHTENLQHLAEEYGYRSYYEAAKALTSQLVEAETQSPTAIPEIMYRLLPSRLGVRIMGTEADLRDLYNIVHRIARYEKRGEDSILICLAYDLRLAFQGRRYKKRVKQAENESRSEPEYLYGEEIDWPTFVLYVKAMRTYTDMARPVRKAVYDPIAKRFEDIYNEALDADFGDRAADIRTVYQHINLRSEALLDYLGDLVEVYDRMNARERKASFAADLLDYFA